MNISISRKEILFLLQSGRCVHCSERMIWNGGNDAMAVTQEHIRPRRKKSKRNGPDNLVLACKRCNTHRGARNINRPELHELSLEAYRMMVASKGYFTNLKGWQG